MRIAIDSFRGEVPRLTPRALADNAAQAAVNARLLSGDLEAWRQFVSEKALSESAPVRTIYLLRDKWLSWNDQVDVARGVVAGDNTDRIYLTCPNLYGRPQWTNYSLATTGAEPYPVTTRPLGVPSPDDPPTLAFDASSVATSNIAIVNAGAEAGTTAGWSLGSGAHVVYTNGDIPGLNAQAGTRFFGGGNASASEAYQDIDIEAEGVLAGQVLDLAWQQATGAAGSKAMMRIDFYDDTATFLSSSTGTLSAPDTANSWTPQSVLAIVPSGAVTARIVQVYSLVGAGPTIDAYIDAITLNSAPIQNFFDGSSLTGWDVSPAIGIPAVSEQWRVVALDATVGNGAPSFLLRGDSYLPWMHRDFSTDRSPLVTVEFDFQQSIEVGHGLLVSLCSNDAGRGAAVLLGPGGVAIANCPAWDDNGTVTEDLGGALPINTWYRAVLTLEQVSASEGRVTVNVTDRATAASVVSNLRANIPIDGPRIGFKGRVGTLEGRWWLDNISITVAPPKTLESSTTTATSYVYTFVNDLGEESGPSEVSDTLLRPDGVGVTVTTPVAVPSGIDAAYGVATKRIYRAVTGASGSLFRFVAEITLATADYVDLFTDEQLGEALSTDGWELPPDDLEGIMALPNGIMVGFRRNQLCFSAQNHPHAWPVAQRLPTDSAIVGIRNVDTTVVIGTRTFVYTASGNSPDSYSMSTPGVAQACVSKRSMGNLFGGVVFASPDGLMLAAGPTQVQNMTAQLFTREQWQALHPESILGVVHDDVYHFFFDPLYSPGGLPAGYAIDTKADGFGVVGLGYHATAAHTDPLRDALFLVLDLEDEPAAVYLPEASTAPNPNGTTIYEFDASDASEMVYRWRGKLNLLPNPACMQVCQVQAADYDNLLLRLYADGDLLFEGVITSSEVFTLPMADAYNELELELLGSSRVRRVQVAEDVMELT